MKTKTCVLAGALVAMCSAVLAGDIYTGNCDATNTDVKSRRSCYTCCNDQNGTSTETSNCQDSCDGVWTRVAVDYFPPQFLDAILASRGDWRAQISFLNDEKLWEWFTADEQINIRVIEMVDWLYQNAADDTVARMAIVTLSWLRAENQFTSEGVELSNLIMLDALEHESSRIRRGALISLQESQAFVGHPRIKVDMMRAAVMDPDQSVRDTGILLLANN